jgi:signal transduction histidine kinase
MLHALDRAMQGAATPFPRIGFLEPRKPRRASHYAALIVLAFVTSSAAFIGATLVSDQRLALVAARARDVADDAMPSIDALSAMRRELAYIHLSLDEAAEGNPRHMPSFDSHMDTYRAALQTYESLPQFPEELPAWERTVTKLNDTEGLVDRTHDLIRAGALHKADVLVESRLAPAMADADQALADLVRANRRQGDLAAIAGERALASSRRIAALLDAVAAALAAVLAVAAVRAVVRSMALERERAAELEAFSARVAHDLRNPLSTAVLSIHAASRGLDASDPRAAALQRCARSLGRVEDLVRDLLAFARAGAAPEPNVRAPLRSIVADLVTDAADLASTNRVRVVVEDLPDCQVGCAPGILQSLIGNLVTNAIKYMPADASERVVTIRAHENRILVRVEVADTGAGVPAEARNRIFQPYVRVQTQQPGLGLGLATVRRLAEAHGGRVGVRAAQGPGSVFWFEMPIFREP